MFLKAQCPRSKLQLLIKCSQTLFYCLHTESNQGFVSKSLWVNAETLRQTSETIVILYCHCPLHTCKIKAPLYCLFYSLVNRTQVEVSILRLNSTYIPSPNFHTNRTSYKIYKEMLKSCAHSWYVVFFKHFEHLSSSEPLLCNSKTHIKIKKKVK